MEHKLIQGGAQYLSFARSRIKALRATGARYAGHRWIMPGGEVVTVRLEGEHDYIRLEGGVDLLAMDSGVVDLKSTAAVSPLRFSNAVLQDTDVTAAYAASFALAATKGRWAKWNSYPAQIPKQQMIGTVEVPKFAGHLKPGAAPSFEAARQPADPQTDPASWVYSPSDSALYAKKLMAASCPASIFTGRARLYVQAMYGRPLHDYGGDNSLEPTPQATGRPSLSATSPPALSLPAYTRKSDTSVYPPVIINTSAGVRYDPASGKHWLLLIDGDNLDIYPLLSSKTGEAMRKYLVKPAVGKTVLTSDDQDKLEAYILALCLPDVRGKFSIAAGAASSGYSMGYSWHWNWSGSAADIVTSTTYDQGGGNTAMESTHRRISVSVDDQGVWSASRSVVEGPSRWAVSRVYWCIAEPDWAAMAPLKSTPKTSILFACDAPFYAFYRGDELQVCRVSVQQVDATANVRNISLGFASTVYGSPVDEFTPGMLDGFCEDIASTSAHQSAHFSCGATGVSNLVIGSTTTSARWDINAKVMTVPFITVPSDNELIPDGQTYIAISGYDVPYSSSGYDHTAFPGKAWLLNDGPPTIDFNRETCNIQRTESSTATVIVPFFDAEALFIEGTSYTSELRSNRQVSARTSQGFAFCRRVVNESGVFGPFYEFITSGPGNILSTSTPDPTTINSAHATTKLACAAGVLDATMSDLGSYHDANEYAQANYTSLCGVHSPGPVIAPGHVTSGLFAAPTFAALVGWV